MSTALPKLFQNFKVPVSFYVVNTDELALQFARKIPMLGNVMQSAAEHGQSEEFECKLQCAGSYARFHSYAWRVYMLREY